MLLGEVLAGLGNETTEVVNSQVRLDHADKLVVYMEPGILRNSTVATEVVPVGFNIFTLLQMPTPAGGSEGWRIVMKNDSIVYEKVSGIFRQVEEVYYHSEVPPQLYWLLLGVYLPLVTIGVVFNVGLLYVVLSTRKLRVDPRNSFIAALAFSDLTLCIFTSPLTLWYTLEGHWPSTLDFGKQHTEYLCKFVKAGQDFPIFMSSFCIMAIACDRFRFIVQNQHRQMTATAGFLFSFLLGLVCCCFVSPIFLKTKMWHFPVLKTTFFCDVDWDEPLPWEDAMRNSSEADALTYRMRYTLVSSSFHFLLTLLVVVVLYSLIYIRLKNRPPSTNEAMKQRRRRVNLLMASITVTFFICWSPMVVYGFVHDFYREALPERDSYVGVGYALCLLCALLTPTANPFYYTIFNSSFKAAVYDMCPCFYKYDKRQRRRRRSRRHRSSRRQRNGGTNAVPDATAANGMGAAGPNGCEAASGRLIVKVDGPSENYDEGSAWSPERSSISVSRRSSFEVTRRTSLEKTIDDDENDEESKV